jgi:hypothetical protein
MPLAQLSDAVHSTASHHDRKLPLGFHRFMISNGIPPAGRKVTFATGFGRCPATG